MNQLSKKIGSMSTGNGVFEIVTGKNERDEHVFSVIVKRTYTIDSNGRVNRCETDHELRKLDAYYENGDPVWSTVQFEYELAPYKPNIDVVVIGKAYAPGAKAVESMASSSSGIPRG